VTRTIVLAILVLASSARAEPALRRQLQADVALGAIGFGLEQPVAAHLALGVEATGFSTFFLPFIGGGVNTYGGGGGVRATWLGERSGHGLYVTSFFRLEGVHGLHFHQPGNGPATATGLMVGQAFRASDKLDVRFGFGGQWVTYDLSTRAGRLTASVPFLAVELVVGYRL